MEGHSSALHDEKLQDKDANHDEDEEIIIEEVGENIEFFPFQFSGVEEVENLQVDEDIEEES